MPEVLRNHPTLDAARVAPLLWIGSKAELGWKISDGGFDYLVLCAEEWQPKKSEFPGVKVLHAPFADDPEGMTLEEAKVADEASTKTARRMAVGDRCLVTCHAGWNRSGLVCAMALAKAAGMDPAQAGEVVRKARGHAALTNPVFVNLLNRARGKNCQLCDAEVVTRRYHEDPVCWIADCTSCRVPMAVLRRHSTKPTVPEMKHMVDLLKQCLPPRRGGWEIDFERRSIPGHWHCHARPVHSPKPLEV